MRWQIEEYLIILLQGNSEQVRYDKNDARYFLKAKFFHLKNGIRIQMPWLWAGFDGSWSCRRVAEVRRQLDEGGIKTVVKVDRMRLIVVFANFCFFII